jgi:hypothetical protein
MSGFEGRRRGAVRSPVRSPVITQSLWRLQKTPWRATAWEIGLDQIRLGMEFLQTHNFHIYHEDNAYCSTI